MVINHEGVYFSILSGASLEPDIVPYRDVTKEQILEILQTHFGVDFGYNVEAWKKYIADNGGWFYNFWEGGLYKTQHNVLMEHIKRNKP